MSFYSTQTPSITPVTEPSNGFSKGDLLAILDKSLASRMDEVMHRLTDCADGRDFDSQRNAAKRSGESLGGAICATEGVIAMAGPGGPFHDILLLNPNNLNIGFADPAGDVARAAGVAADFVRDYAPLLGAAIVDPAFLEQLAFALFFLAIDTLMNGAPLDEKNRIPSSLIKTSPTPTATPTSSSSTKSCPDQTKSPVSYLYLYNPP